MKKLFKQLLPALLGAAAFGCATTEEPKQEIVKVQEFSPEQLAFQRMIREQEAAQIGEFRETQIREASLKMNAAIDAINKINNDIAALAESNEVKKQEVLAASKKLVEIEKRKLANSTFQAEYWKFVEEGKELAAKQPKQESKSKLNPANWFAAEETTEMTDEESDMADFTAEEFKIAIRINNENQERSFKEYESMKQIVLSNIKAIVDQCKKEIAALDKTLADTKTTGEKQIAAEHKKIDFEQEVLDRYAVQTITEGEEIADAEVEETEEAVEETTEDVTETEEAVQ